MLLVDHERMVKWGEGGISTTYRKIRIHIFVFIGQHEVYCKTPIFVHWSRKYNKQSWNKTF